MFFTNMARYTGLRRTRSRRRENGERDGDRQSDSADAGGKITAMIPIREYKEGRYLFM